MVKVSQASSVIRHGLGFLLTTIGMKIILTVLGVLIVFALLYPVIFVVLTSLIKGQVIVTSFEDIRRFGLSLEHYYNAFAEEGFVKAFTTSVLVAFLSILVSVLVITPAAYAFSRFKFWGKDTLLYTYLILSQIGGGFGIAAVIALYVFFLKLQVLGIPMLGNPFILPLVYTAGAVPFQTWLIKNYFDSIPRDLDEAAFIDGASWSMIVFRVILPTSKPAMVVIALFAFMGAWGDFIIASFLRVRTLGAFIYETAAGQTIYWADFAARTIIYAIPIIILYAVAQRYIGEAMVRGTIKR